MKSLNIKLLTVCLTLASSQMASALSFKSSLRQIQLPSTAERKAATFTRPTVPGSMTIAGQLYCGDADVERYVHDQDGHFDIVNGDTEVITYGEDMSYSINITSTKQPLYTTVGYWLVPDGNEPLPTKDNFNTVSWGYMAVSPDGSKTLDYFFPASNATDARNDVMQMLRKEVSTTLSLSDKPFGYSANYRLYMGVFGCINPMDQSGEDSSPSVPASLSASDYRPSNADLNYSMIRQNSLDIISETFRDSRWNNKSTALAMVDSHNKVKVTKIPGNAVAIVDSSDAAPVTFKIDSSGDGSLSEAILGKIKDIIELPYPTFSDYDNAVAAANEATEQKRAADDALSDGLALIAPNSTARTELDQAIEELDTARREKETAESALAAGTGSQSEVDSKTAAFNTAQANKNAKQSAYNSLVSNVEDVLRPAAANAATNETAKRAAETSERSRRKDVYAEFMSSRLSAIIPSSIPSASSSAEKILKCRDFGLNVSTSAKVYQWENFPLNASCKALYEGYLPLQSLYNDLVNPDFYIDEDAQLERKKKLVQNLYLAAAFESAQNYIQANANYKVVNHHCFKGSTTRSYIDRLIVSYPIKVNYDATTHKYVLDSTATHLHPEPLYALRNGLTTYAKYTRESISYAYTGSGSGSGDGSTEDVSVIGDDSGSGGDFSGGGTYTTTVTPAGANSMADINSVYCQIYGDACQPSEMLPEWKNSGFLIPVNGSNRSLHTIDANTFDVPMNINLKIRGLSRDGFACQGVIFC